MTRRQIPWYIASFHPGNKLQNVVNKGRGEPPGSAYVRGTRTHLHPMQLRVVVGLGKARKHEIVRILKERAGTEAGWSEH